MKIHRKELLAALDSCAAGLGSKGNVEQSQCYVFRDGNNYARISGYGKIRKAKRS